MQATSHEELEEIEQLVSRLHQRDALPNRFSPPPVWAGAPVHELPIDLTSTALAQSAPVAETLPPGARKLTQTGLQKVRRAIETATSLDELEKLDDALATGDTPLLQRELSLNAEDLDDESVDDEYDPFEDFTVEEDVVAPAIVEVPPSSHASPSVPSAKRSLGGLLGDYHDEVDSDPEPDVPAMPAKRQKPSLGETWVYRMFTSHTPLWRGVLGNVSSFFFIHLQFLFIFCIFVIFVVLLYFLLIFFLSSFLFFFSLFLFFSSFLLSSFLFLLSLTFFLLALLFFFLLSFFLSLLGLTD